MSSSLSLPRQPQTGIAVVLTFSARVSAAGPTMLKLSHDGAGYELITATAKR